ncbi:MAG: hypothetical protein AB7V13_06235 [Pseudorhodoplanes sp.]|uniref:hypothetical protein n=1 Tax=Pseudorhodoplanes sp. TaxID=1934341 RepID=UPI003D107671
MAKLAKETIAPSRPDGRRAMLVYMAPNTIRALKKAALDEERNAYEIVEESVTQWLTARRKKVKQA